MPFTDPMADGPAVQASSLRALKSGANMARTSRWWRNSAKRTQDTPIVLMGYYNPIHAYGAARFASDAAAAGADGLIVVDLPPEEDEVLRVPAKAQGLDMIRLVTPTTDDARLKRIRRATPAAFSIMSRSPASPAPRVSPEAEVERRWRASASRHRSARRGGLRHPDRPSRPRRSPASPTAWWWVRPLSARSRTTWTPGGTESSPRCWNFAAQLAASTHAARQVVRYAA